jgi:uncharacterized Zn finger protein
MGGDCKHVVAVLLTYARRPEAFAQAPEMEGLLAELSEEQLRQLVATLLKHKPELHDWFRITVSSLNINGTEQKRAPKRQVAVDTDAYRRQVKQAVGMVDYRRHWETIWDAVHALGAVHAQAAKFLQGGDFHNALALMRVLGEEVAPQYGDLEEECQLAEFLEVWSDDFAQAILGAGLSKEERIVLSKDLDRWAAELSDYGLDETLDRPMAACERGWDAVPSDAEAYAIDLTDLQLNVLGVQNDDEAYLKFSLQNQAHYRYAERLLQLGRVDEAVEHALGHPLSAEESLNLAKLLREKERTEAAYEVGRKGLNSTGHKYNLAEWVAAMAETMGHIEDARHAWLVAFDEIPRLEAYRHLKRLSGQTWHNLREKIIHQLREKNRVTTLIEIWIEDGDINQAIQAWENYPYGGYTLLGQLVDAAATTHPDWAVKYALAEAESLISKASKYYPHAVRWLGKIKAIYLQHNRIQDWQQCLADIRTRHGRKYSLMGQIDQQLR